MLAIQRPRDDSDKCVLNVVPCRIHRDGPTKVTKRFWNPSSDGDGTRTAYFRGRRLRARVVKLPANYQGFVLKKTDKTLPQTTSKAYTPQYNEDDRFEDEDDDGEEEAPEPIKIVEEVSTFDDLLVWGHDRIPTSEDPFVKGVEEWIKFAEAIHLNTPVTVSHTNIGTGTTGHQQGYDREDRRGSKSKT